MEDRHRQAPERKDEWVVVRSCIWIHEAQLVKSLLDGSGVESIIPDEYFLSANPHYGLALGGARVMVRASDLEQASAILDAVEFSEAGSEDPDGDEAA